MSRYISNFPEAKLAAAVAAGRGYEFGFREFLHRADYAPTATVDDVVAAETYRALSAGGGSHAE